MDGSPARSHATFPDLETISASMREKESPPFRNCLFAHNFFKVHSTF